MATLGVTLVAVACGLAVWGLVDVYLVPLDTWRDSGVPGWFEEQLGLAYKCLSGLPENWILNTDEESPARRLVSTFLSPLATAYTLVVVLLLLAAARPRRWTVSAGVVVYAGLLWTHTRAAFLALAAGLVVLALLRRSWVPAALAGGSIVVSLAFVAVFPTIGPETTYTATEVACLRENAAAEGQSASGALDPGESSTASHFRSASGRDPGPSPSTRGASGSGTPAYPPHARARRSRRASRPIPSSASTRGCSDSPPSSAGSSRSRWPFAAARRGSTASLVAVAVLGLQTDVIGIHWLAVVVFALAGSALRAAPGEPPPEEAV